METVILEWLLRALEGFHLAKYGTGWLRPRLRHRLMKLWMKMLHGSIDYYPTLCDASMLEEVLALGERFYEYSTALQASEIRERHLRNPHITTAIVSFDRRTGLRAVAGFYVLLPLTKRGTEAIQEGRIEGSRHLRADDVCQTFKRFTSLYVSAVFGADNFSRIATSSFLLTEILDHKDRRPALKFVFTRPTTAEGGVMFEQLTGRTPVLGPIQAIDLDGNDVRDRYMERGIRVKTIVHRRRKAADEKRRATPIMSPMEPVIGDADGRGNTFPGAGAQPPASTGRPASPSAR